MSKKLRVVLSGGPAFKGWTAAIEGQPELAAPTMAELGSKVRGVLGDAAWKWKHDLGEDTDWHIALARHHLKNLREGMLANTEARDQLADAVWALGLASASEEDAAAIIGVPVDWVREVWPAPDAYEN